MSTNPPPPDREALKERIAALEKAGKFGPELMQLKSQLMTARAPGDPAAIAARAAELEQLRAQVAALESRAEFNTAAAIKSRILALLHAR